ncbi:aconitase X swivel domain-containing protein [Stella sp.]|uniref:aconitase X swivel domain-containing protein n=1 Tax=Stella sp. TaxID=2912054 RepID=UPI0035B4B2F3
MTGSIRGRGIVEGQAAGPVLIATEAISFLGDVDINTGTVVGDLPSVHGRSVKGTVLVFPYSRGSAGAWRFLYQLFKHGNHPVAIVSRDAPDPSVVQGAILAGIPIVSDVPQEFWGNMRDGETIAVDGTTGEVRAVE